MVEIRGSCLCGKTTYNCSSKPLFLAICHCSACQKSTGSAFSPVVGVKRADLTVLGDSIKVFEGQGDSGKKTFRHFCSECGTTLFGIMESKPEIAFIKAGTLDDNSWYHPQINVYWDNHLPWITQLNSIPNSPKMP